MVTTIAYLAKREDKETVDFATFYLDMLKPMAKENPLHEIGLCGVVYASLVKVDDVMIMSSLQERTCTTTSKQEQKK